jgi:ABC-type bacteriocin/lantibiotic exporter with double-glycine peptidase domain
MPIGVAVAATSGKARRRQVPSVLQMESAECGAACLAMVLASFGRWESLDAIRDACGVSRDGTSVADIVEAARHYGLEASAYSREVEALASLPLPQVLFWDFNHFVVLEGMDGRGYSINDPAYGPRLVEPADFDRRFTGVTIAFRPGAGFVKKRKPPGLLARLPELLRGSLDVFACIIVMSLAIAALAVLMPGFTRVFIDEYIVQGRGDWLAPLLGAMLAVGLLRMGLTWLQVHGLLLLQTKITAVMSAGFMWRLLHLPYEFFMRRSPVEIASRGQLTGQLAGAVSGPFAQASVAAVSMAVYATAMMLFSPALTVLVLALSLVNALVMRLLGPALRETATRAQMASSQAHAETVQGAALLEHARATGTEPLLFDRMVRAQLTMLNAEQASGFAATLLTALPFAMSQLISISVLGAGALVVLRTDMTIGMLMGFVMLAELFAAALSVLTGLGNAGAQTASAFYRLDDKADERGQLEAPGLHDRATGRVAAERLGFSYTNGPKILSGVDFRAQAGEFIVITGASGSGKSTLARLLAGLLEPSEGTLSYEIAGPSGIAWGRPGARIAYVESAPFLPPASLRAVLTLWTPDIAAPEIERALADADMAAAIVQRPGGIEGRIGEGGADFSGGERQRLGIARALLRDPRVLILDDATSALDEASEARVIGAAKRRGITVILFTNRASAARHADRILALGEGRLHPLPGVLPQQPASAPRIGRPE